MQCKALTGYSDGWKKCKRVATHGDYCWQHCDIEPQNKKAPTGKTARAQTLYLIEKDQVVAGPHTDPQYLLDIAAEKVSAGTLVEHLRIVAIIHTFDIESVNLKLTEA